MHSRTAPVLTTLVLLAAHLPAQFLYLWNQPQTAARPFARSRHAMAYDGARAQTVLFGGHNGAYMNDTWVFDGTAWQLRQLASSPPARADHAMAYDPVRQRVVLIGGNNGNALADIWEWDGAGWTSVATAVPGVAGDGAACYDPVQGAVFYNRGTANLLWNGATATTLTVANPNGGAYAMVYDAASGGVLTVGGFETRRFRPFVGWEVLQTNQMFALTDYALAVDPVTHRPVLQGGDGTVGNGNGAGRLETWAWIGTHWIEVRPPLPAAGRADHAMVFDLARNVFVMFGGRRNQSGITDETWELSVQDHPAAYELFGQGCSGASSFLPALAPELAFNTAPILGGTFFARVDGLPPSALVFGAVGFSDQSYQGQALPLDLGAFGMPGCLLLISLELTSTIGAASASGWVWWPIRLPAEPGLLDVVFLQQAAALHAPANPTGVIWSNAGRGTIGLR